MLTFVGLGLYDEHSVTLAGRDAIESADRVFAEFYTGILAGTTLKTLETFHGIEITVCDREGIEGDPAPILEAATQGAAVLLVVGDPMIATTHVDLRLRAHEAGIDTRIVHGVSAHTAASSLTGLQNYRFGKATTLPFETGAGVPPSVIDTITENQQRNLHTLVYLDIDATHDEYLSIDTAAERLADRYRDAFAVAIARAGSPTPVVDAASLRVLAEREYGDPLHMLVIPADLHRIEAEALHAFGNAPPDILDEGGA